MVYWCYPLYTCRWTATFPHEERQGDLQVSFMLNFTRKEMSMKPPLRPGVFVTMNTNSQRNESSPLPSNTSSPRFSLRYLPSVQHSTKSSTTHSLHKGPYPPISPHPHTTTPQTSDAYPNRYQTTTSSASANILSSTWIIALCHQEGCL